LRRIATEEAFSIPEVVQALNAVSKSGQRSLDMRLIRDLYGDQCARPQTLRGLLDWDERLRVMDEHGVDMHVLSLTAPGVQMFDTATAVELARLANDVLAEQVAKHPTRFAGLASFAPQDPKAAAREIERARTGLKLHGLIVNGHTHDEWYDQEKFFPIFEAAEAHDAAIYIHPRAPRADMAGGFDRFGMENALWGYGVEVSTHALRLIFSGLFDRFPRLKIVLGHMGEGIPFWLWRIDYMHRNSAIAQGVAPRLELTPSEYFKRNFCITTSGQENPLALQYSIDMLGAENVMWAIDYPYQPTAPAVKFMDEAPLDAATKALVYGENAARLFHIG
jgi:2,3-dihydroxybenzoate decarboxylase/5-carboxyvanillate decarboxylase